MALSRFVHWQLLPSPGTDARRVFPECRVYPFIQVVRDQTLNMTLANVVKTDMEVRGGHRCPDC